MCAPSVMRRGRTPQETERAPIRACADAVSTQVYESEARAHLPSVWCGASVVPVVSSAALSMPWASTERRTAHPEVPEVGVDLYDRSPQWTPDEGGTEVVGDGARATEGDGRHTGTGATALSEQRNRTDGRP
jgi:hypothetical protein